ncbi:serine aminopeptidase domain-containing protein [Mucilaginibacter calamicampi]|uniref:Serine aminopeptidase domain-containing protein n=1 Tax=Mucilaginibacter calamicampi TaxID=1302352 RepID=A0ABW2Z1T7_9SPHI
MKRFSIVILSIFFPAMLFAQSEPAKYKAAVALFEKFYNQNLPDSISARFSAAMKGQLPPAQFKQTTTQLKTQLGDLTKVEFSTYSEPLAVYKATFKNGVFSLNISLNNNNEFIGLLLSPYQQQAASMASTDPALSESPILLKTLSGTISGTVAVPANTSGKMPVVLIIPGSGTVDRNGNSPQANINTNTYKQIAESLAKNGIASLRYDKRMVGQSVGNQKEDNLRFDDYTDDAIGFINLLKADSRFSKVIVLGHSEGSLVGILASGSSEGNVNAFISVAGAGEPGEKVLKEQMKSQPSYLSDGLNKIMDSLKMGRPQKKVDPQLYFIIRPSIQLFLMSWCRFDPQREIKKLKIPTLIVQGTTDLQINVSNAEKLKTKNATLAIIPGMNHVLKEAPEDRQQNLATYNKPDLPLKPEFVTSVVGFIKGLK